MIIVNPDRQIVWRFLTRGALAAGQVLARPGYLAHPDDAYLLADRQVQVADIIKCRVLWLDRRKHIVHSIGTAGDCSHDPPRALLEPNGDTPPADGGVLVTEIAGWIDHFSATGQLMWSIKAPMDYPSDAQLLPNGNVLVAGFHTPGRIDILAQRATPLDLRTIDWSRSA